ncbi:hypothetical protein BCR44DRAFT_43223 [Catenaria anguillulae PL171]|uniref:Uncharacterized protein n=1 Tax=Catenaria anguillulae PL171 TaxID=765915 RepID=A0A1Y2H6H6_9FUNG|nr:hypothetical protein BCR44DRAFT_43223 [Catenaria anguillulae PL171]
MYRTAISRIFTSTAPAMSAVRHPVLQVFMCRAAGVAALTHGASLLATKTQSYATATGPKETDQAISLFNEGNQALQADKPHLALAKYLESIQLHPTAEALFNAGNVYLQMGRPEDALRMYQQSLDLAEHPDTLINMANVTFLIQKNPAGAMDLYRRAAKAHKAMSGNPMSEDERKAHGEIWFNFGCVADAAASQMTLPDKLAEAVESWNEAESAFGKAAARGIERADMLQKNVQIKRVAKLKEWQKKGAESS